MALSQSIKDRSVCLKRRFYQTGPCPVQALLSLHAHATAPAEQVGTWLHLAEPCSSASSLLCARPLVGPPLPAWCLPPPALLQTLPPSQTVSPALFHLCVFVNTAPWAWALSLATLYSCKTKHLGKHSLGPLGILGCPSTPSCIRTPLSTETRLVGCQEPGPACWQACCCWLLAAPWL